MAWIPHIPPGPATMLARGVRAANLPFMAIGFPVKPFGALMIPPELLGWSRDAAANDSAQQ